MDKKTELQQAFVEIQGARSRFQIDAFVVGGKFTEEYRYAQVVLELQLKHTAMRVAAAKRSQMLAEIEEKQAELEQLELAAIGAAREYQHLLGLWEASPVKYTREQIEGAAQKEYRTMIATNSLQDLAERGTITAGNQDAIRMSGMVVRRVGEGTEIVAMNQHNSLGREKIELLRSAK